MKKHLTLVAILALTASTVASANGFYVGGGVGGSELNNEYTYSTNGKFFLNYQYSDTTESNTAVGINGTLLAGYAWESPSSYFIGLEVFDNKSSTKVTNKGTGLVTTEGSSSVATNPEISLKINNVYGIRALPGMHFTPDTVGYGIVGLTRGDMTLTGSNDGESGSNSYNLQGYQLGVGAMTNLSPHMALRADVIYTGYESKTIYSYSNPYWTGNVKVQPSTLEANLVAVYKFG